MSESNLIIPLTARVPTRGVAPKLRWFNGKNTWGKNPDGKPLYRVVWSESRTWLLGGSWPDNGEIEYRHCPYYGGRQEWVLEKWLPAVEYAGAKESWGSTIDHSLAAHGITVYTMGPYPSKGWYEHIYSFSGDAPPNLDELAPLFEASKDYTLEQLKAGVQLFHERKHQEWSDNFDDAVEDLAPAGGYAMTNLNPAKPTADTAGLSDPRDLAAAMKKYRGGEKQNVVTFDRLPRQRGNSMGRAPKVVAPE